MRSRWLSAAGISVRGLACLTMVSVAAAWLAIAIPDEAAAQGTTSRVTGVVTDASGAVIPGAAVTLTNEGTGVAFTAISNDRGAYAFEAVQVGAYTVSVELSGFKAFSSTGNIVAIGQPKTVNARLEAGALTETIVVAGGAETIQLSTSGNYGTVIDQKTVEALPIVGARGRNPLNLVLTQPGVVSGANTGGGTHVNGARDRAWNFTLDGIDVNESSAGGANFSPLRTNPDSLAEFKVLTGNQTAEFGRNSGGQVAMVSRSGTNQLKGSGFYFGRRTAWAADEWESKVNLVPKREFDQDISGFSVGGPIKRNKAFFYVNMQFLQADQTNIVTRTVLTELARTGLFRYVIGGRNQPANAATPSIDASGNVLPGVNLGTYNVAANDPAGLGLNGESRRLLGLMPLPNNFNTGDGLNTAGYTFRTPETEKQHDISMKFDYAVSDRHHTFARVSWGRQDTECDSANTGQPAFPGLPCQVDTRRDPLNVASSWRWNPTSSLVNEFVVGYNHFAFDFVNPGADASGATFDPVFVTAPENFTIGNAREINTWQVVNNTSFLKGGHSVKFGTNMRFQQHKDERGSVGGTNIAPMVDFSTTINAVDPNAFRLPTNIQTANDLPTLRSTINFLLGRVGSINQGFVSTGGAYAPGGTPFTFDARFRELDFFIQDTWKPRQNLTVDLGLRWELKYSPRNPQGLLRRPNQRVAVGEAPSNTLSWVEGNLYRDDLDNLGPSVGAAWDPKGDGKQVIRGNYRLAYDRINTFVISSAIFQSIPGITAAFPNTDYGQAGGRIPANPANLPSTAPTATPESFLTPPVSAGSMRVMDTDLSAPMTHGWALSYQRELWGRNAIEIAYIGRRAENLFGAYNANQAIIQENGFLDAFNVVKAGGESPLINLLLGPDSRRAASESGSQFMRRQFQSELALSSVGAVAAAIGSRLQGGRTLPELAGLGSYFFYPYPQFLSTSTGMTVIDSGDWSRYHALQVKFERRQHKGVGFVLGYTLAKSQDTRSFDPAFTTVSTGNAQSASSTPFDIHDRARNFAPSDFDRRHVLQGAFTLELPFGQGHWIGGDATGLIDRLINGWQLAGIYTISSGRPFTVYSGSNTLSNVVQTPASCSGCNASDGSVHDEGGLVWYLTPEERARYGTPAAGEFGNTGRNFLVGPGSFNLDLSLSKRTRLLQGHQLEVRVDATNVTNTPTFGLPTATATSTIFGRIFNTVTSTSRKVQIGVRYSF